MNQCIRCMGGPNDGGWFHGPLLTPAGMETVRHVLTDAGRIAVYQWSRDEAGRECWRFVRIEKQGKVTYGS